MFKSKKFFFRVLGYQRDASETWALISISWQCFHIIWTLFHLWFQASSSSSEAGRGPPPAEAKGHTMPYERNSADTRTDGRWVSKKNRGHKSWPVGANLWGRQSEPISPRMGKTSIWCKYSKGSKILKIKFHRNPNTRQTTAGIQIFSTRKRNSTGRNWDFSIKESFSTPAYYWYNIWQENSHPTFFSEKRKRRGNIEWS